jgi:hypothetical protein
MIDRNKVHRVVQYALLVAAEADEFFERELGPIHLIKYLYLADMDYAKFHNGETYTGLDWRFHHFGPWTATALQELEPALAAIGARRTQIPSGYGEKDFERWSTQPNHAKKTALGADLPPEVRASVPYFVGKFHNNTGALLHFVYATPPMLRAAPEEPLDFRTMERAVTRQRTDAFVPFADRLSATKRKALRSGMAELRNRFAQRATKGSPVRQAGQVREDPVFDAGVAWLDHLAGECFPEEGATVRFSPEVWTSEARRGDG